jgi:phosphoribosylformylglycinamidine (FGAM) synthase PurS component
MARSSITAAITVAFEDPNGEVVVDSIDSANLKTVDMIIIAKDVDMDDFDKAALVSLESVDETIFANACYAAYYIHLRFLDSYS